MHLLYVLSQIEENSIISNLFTTMINHPNIIIKLDFNAHLRLKKSLKKDHKGELIEDILLNSNYITLNTLKHEYHSIKHNSPPQKTSSHLQQTCMIALAVCKQNRLDPQIITLNNCINKYMNTK